MSFIYVGKQRDITFPCNVGILTNSRVVIISDTYLRFTG